MYRDCSFLLQTREVEPWTSTSVASAPPPLRDVKGIQGDLLLGDIKATLPGARILHEFVSQGTYCMLKLACLGRNKIAGLNFVNRRLYYVSKPSPVEKDR